MSEPLGFTREDVALLRGIVKQAHMLMENRPDGYWVDEVYRADRRAGDLADRIEALLPPPESP